MCGRYSNSTDPRRLASRYQALPSSFTFHPSNDIRPTVQAPVVVREGPRNALKLMRWGFAVPWTKAPLFNAKGETILEKPTFKKAFLTRRCLVPADAFFEWRMDEWVIPGKIIRNEYREDFRDPDTIMKEKRKYEFRVAGEKIFSLAGLWTSWTDPRDSREVGAFTIVTTAPNTLLAQYHDRMPVILSTRDEKVWIDPDISDELLLQGLLKPFNPELMTAMLASD